MAPSGEDAEDREDVACVDRHASEAATQEEKKWRSPSAASVTISFHDRVVESRELSFGRRLRGALFDLLGGETEQ